MGIETQAEKSSLIELKNNLTKRNLNYVQEVEKQLKNEGYSEEQQESVVYEMTEKILTQQKQGITARKLFNLTPTEYVASLGAKTEKKPEETSRLWLGIDGGLLILGVMMLISGISSYFQGQPLGLIVLLITGVIGGFAMNILRKYATIMRSGQKGGTLKYMFVSVILIISWIFIITVVQVIIPPKMNIALSPAATAVIGALVLAFRFYVKKKKNIPSL